MTHSVDVIAAQNHVGKDDKQKQTLYMQQQKKILPMREFFF